MLQENDNKIDNKFCKPCRISSHTIFTQLIKKNNTIFQYPLKCYYLFSPLNDSEKNAVAVSVSKKYFKRAVDRNLIKRRIREIYRLNNHKLLYNNTIEKNRKIDILFVFVGSSILSYKEIESSMLYLLHKISSL